MCKLRAFSSQACKNSNIVREVQTDENVSEGTDPAVQAVRGRCTGGTELYGTSYARGAVRA